MIETTIKDICKIKSGKRIPKEYDFSECITEHPYIRARDIKNGKINTNELVYIDDNVFEKIKKYIINTGDIAITIVGASIGDVGYAMADVNGFNLTENAVRLTSFNENINSRYVFYCLNSQEGEIYMKQVAGGAAQPKLGIYKIENMPLRLPEKEVQDKIADILSAYDDLIENNQKQIKLLEEAAQRLYKEWFVDLHFPGYEDTKIVDGVPEGWISTPIGEFIMEEIGGGWGDEELSQKCTQPAYVIRGTDIYGITHGDYSSIPFRYHAESNLKMRSLQNGDIIFEVSGGSKTEGVAKTCLISSKLLEQYNHPVMCASFCKKIRPKEGFSQYLFDSFQFMRKSGKTSEYDKKSASSIVNYRWKDFLIQENLLVPSDDILRQYNKMANAIFADIQAKSISVELAKQARARLLPKLMSGELEV